MQNAISRRMTWLINDARDWTRDKNPWYRLPLFFWGIYILFRVLTNARYFTVFDWLNLAIHELGHIIALPLPHIIHVLAGSFAQIAVPIGSMVMFLRQRDYFAVSFCFCWLAESLLNLNHYIGDAQAMALKLANLFGPESVHDWNFILSKFGMLSWTHFLANVTWFAGFVSILVFLVTAGWLLWQMPRLPKIPKK